MNKCQNTPITAQHPSTDYKPLELLGALDSQKLAITLEAKGSNTPEMRQTMTQMLHVWNIYLHLP